MDKNVEKALKKLLSWYDSYSILTLAMKNPYKSGYDLGFSLGEWANEKHGTLSPLQKTIWEIIRPVHHGKIGKEIRKEGVLRNDYFLIGIGDGLMKSDFHDIDDWERR